MSEIKLVGIDFSKLTWMTTKEAAIYLRVTANNLKVMVCRGIVRPYKLNNRNRFQKDELDKLIKSSLKDIRR
jgi:excisionase family DNA binding protein